MRVLTWNLWWRFGPWEQRRHAILDVLRAERPDVCGLQEVWEAGGENLAGWLAAELGMHWAWAPGEVFPHWRGSGGEPGAGVGNAVLSRWPVTERAVERLPAGDGPEEVRVALFARIGAPGGPVPFFTTHLHAGPAGSAVRCVQAAALARFVASRRGRGAFPPVVTGDFNAQPESDELRLFGGMLTAPAVPGQVLVDVWRSAGPDEPWATWDLANPYLAPPHVAAAAPYSTRIDYIHTGLPGPGGAGRVTAVRRAGHGPVAGVWASDHAAVVAELAGPGAGELPDAGAGEGTGG